MKNLLLLLLLFMPGSVFASGVPGQFDYYVLALSWSPEHCAERPSDRGQCGRPLGFVLHGLWPQYWRGYPSDCTRQAASPAALKDVRAKFPGLYPNDALFSHEWKKHGTCSGLDPDGYYTLSRKTSQSVSIPAAFRQPGTPFRTTTKRLKTDFAQANPGMSQDSLAVFCNGSGRFMKEVLVCLDKSGGHGIKCSAEIERKAGKSCAEADFLVRSVR